MSRLDYITIAIVAVCILAIIFLVYKMSDLFKGGKDAEKIETVQDSVELEDDGVYDYEIDDKVDSTETGQPAKDETPKTNPATTTPATSTPAKEATPSTKTTEPEKPTSSPSVSKGGKFMVFGGTFTKKSAANEQVALLRKKGYSNATVEIFDRGKYAVVLVDRFEYMADAERLQKKLQAEGISAYIKMKDK